MPWAGTDGVRKAGQKVVQEAFARERNGPKQKRTAEGDKGLAKPAVHLPSYS